ncbi:Ras-like protein 1, partial [Hypsizygus marmoreus]
DITTRYLDQSREGHAFILVYSITRRYTYQDVVNHYKTVRRVKGQPNVIFALVGNKCDLEFDREVSFEEGAALAQELDCQFFETSSKTGQNVEFLIATLVQNLQLERPRTVPWFRDRQAEADDCHAA